MRALLIGLLSVLLCSCDAILDVGPGDTLLSGTVQGVAGPPSSGFHYEPRETSASLTRYSGCRSYDVLRVRGADAQGRHDVEVELFLAGLPDELPRGASTFVWARAGDAMHGSVHARGLLPGLDAPAVFEPSSAELTLERAGRGGLKGRLVVTASGGSLVFSSIAVINRVQPTRRSAPSCP